MTYIFNITRASAMFSHTYNEYHNVFFHEIRRGSLAMFTAITVLEGVFHKERKVRRRRGWGFGYECLLDPVAMHVFQSVYK